MTLPQVNLDDRRFQELVNEARQRISQACPEWTEHNVSDPGITLIEQFAWIADMLLYRLNRIPDKLHVALLDLLDIRLHGPTSARTELRFRLAAPPERPLEIPAASTEVGTAAHGRGGVRRLSGLRGIHDRAHRPVRLRDQAWQRGQVDPRR